MAYFSSFLLIIFDGHSVGKLNSMYWHCFKVSMMERDFYLGRILTGRVSSGLVRIGDRVHGLRNKDSGVEKIEDGKVRGSIFASL